MAAKNYNEAIKQYKAVEPLIAAPKSKYGLLIKRSEALAECGEENWEQALKDANEVQLLFHACVYIYESLPGNQNRLLNSLGLRAEACSVV